MSPDLLTGIATVLLGVFLVSFFAAVLLVHLFVSVDERSPVDISERRGA